MARRITLLSALLLLGIITACGGPTVTGVVSVQIIGGDRDVVATKSELLTPAVTAGPGVAVSVTWSSSDESVAIVDANGVVHATALGSTQVTATSTADATKSGSVVVRVVKPTIEDGAFMASVLQPTDVAPFSGAALLLFSTEEMPVSRTAVTELEWPFFVGPLSAIGADGAVVVELPPGADLPAEVQTTADKLFYGIDEMVDCSLATSSAAVMVTPVVFELISVPGVMLLGFDGPSLALIANLPVDVGTPPTPEQLAALRLYTWVHAAADVSVMTSGAGCDFGSGALSIDVDLAQGWNQLEWQLEIDEVTEDLIGLSLRNSEGTDIHVSPGLPLS